MNVKNEELFQEFSLSKVELTEVGREQFIDHQSKGILPAKPDGYFQSLSDGKRRFDFLASEYHKLYLIGEWWGWLQLWKDWQHKLEDVI